MNRLGWVVGASALLGCVYVWSSLFGRPAVQETAPVPLAPTPHLSPVAPQPALPASKPSAAAIDPCLAARSSVVTLFAGRDFGTGSIVRSDGLVLTNYHVVRKARGQPIRARTASDDQYLGEVVASDRERDLALVKLQTSTALSALRLANSHPLQPGQTVCAIGSPYGRSGTLTRGTLTTVRSDGTLQSDLMLFPGNSGGPLLNSQGEMIGLNRAIWQSETGENTGISFAISSATAQEFLRQTAHPTLDSSSDSIANSTLPPSSPGSNPDPIASIPTSPLDSDGSRLGVVVNQELEIRRVEPGSPAAQAGLDAGDRLLAVNGGELRAVNELQEFLRDRPSSAIFTVRRDQQLTDVQVNF